MKVQRDNLTNALEMIGLEKYLEKLQTDIIENSPDFGDGEPVLILLYEVYADSNKMDKIGGTLCRDHQRSGFVEGIKVGIRLREELAEKLKCDN